MKNIISAMITAVFISAGMFVGCDTASEKLETAQINAAEANTDLKKANEEYLAEVEKYKIETAQKISANNKSIAEFKTRISKEKKAAKAAYTKKIAELESKNTDLEKKIAEFKAEGKSQWESFKTEFSHDMDGLGKALKDLTVGNKK